MGFPRGIEAIRLPPEVIGHILESAVSEMLPRGIWSPRAGALRPALFDDKVSWAGAISTWKSDILGRDSIERKCLVYRIYCRRSDADLRVADFCREANIARSTFEASWRRGLELMADELRLCRIAE